MADEEMTVTEDKKNNSSSFMWVIILLAIGVGVYFWKFYKKTTPETVAEPVKKEETSMFGSIQEALSKSLSLNCDFSDESGRKTLAYIKAGQVRADFTGKTAAESGSVIVKNNKVYFWNSTTNQGLEMEFDPTAQKAEANNQGQMMMGSLEKYKQSCKPGTVSDSLFIVPDNIKFSNVSTMMKDAVKNLPTSLPQ